MKRNIRLLLIVLLVGLVLTSVWQNRSQPAPVVRQRSTPVVAGESGEDTATPVPIIPPESVPEEPGIDAPRPAAVPQAVSSEWTQDAHDPQRTGYTPEEFAEPWTIAWSWNGPDAEGGTGNHFYNAPKEARTVTGGAHVYVPAGNQGLYALTKRQGKVGWNLRDTSFNATPAYDPATETLFAGGANGKLYKIDPASGQVLKTYDAGSPLNKSVLLVGAHVYIVADNGQLHKVNTTTMARAWVYAANAPVATLPSYSASRDVIVYATADLFVHAVKNTDGTAKWRVKPTPNPATFPFEFHYGWPVIAEQHGVVFVRMRLNHDAMSAFPSRAGIFPLTNAEVRTHLLLNPAQKNLFALNLDNGAEKFIPAVGYGSVEGFLNGRPYGEMGAQPVVKVWPDGKEVVYIHFRNGQSNPPDYRWDGHMGEMVLDDTTVPGLVAGDMRFIRMSRFNGYGGTSYVYIIDEQSPITMAGNTLFHAHWGASESVEITDRSALKGLTYATPIETAKRPTVIRRQANCSNRNVSTHSTSCGLTLYGDGRYWDGPGFWVYWNVIDPPGSPISSAYSAGVLPRYTYVSDGLMVVEGNGGDLTVFSKPRQTLIYVPTIIR